VLDEHLGYLTDSVRLDRFRQAIDRVVNPGSTVVDLGCGSGVLGLLCLQAGAGRIYAIESTGVIEVARETLRHAGLLDRVAFLNSDSSLSQLAERVDVAICDHVGFFGIDYSILPLLRDARRRFLKPDGKIVPKFLRIRLAAVQSPIAWALANEWAQDKVPEPFRWLRDHGLQHKHAVNLKSDELLGAPALLGDIDLTVDHPEFFRWTTELVVDRPGVLHGLAGWFECELADGVWMTNSPLAEDAIERSQAYLPIAETMTVAAGETLRVDLMIRPDDHSIAWHVTCIGSGRHFRHSTWNSQFISTRDIDRNRPGYVPRLSRSGQLRALVLGYCDGMRSRTDIEQLLLREHPDLVSMPDAISRLVSRVLGGDNIE
jgi:protein arginine N-methyltransferase 1